MLPQLDTCPTCGSPKLRKVRKNLRRTYRDQRYVVPNVEYLECPDCNEQLFDHAAMQKIEAHSPAYAKRRTAEKKAAAGR